MVQLDVMNADPKEYAKLFNVDQPTTIVVNNAGIMKNRYFLKTDPAHIEAMIKTNVHPYVYMAKYATNHFIANAENHNHKNAMLFTSSMAAHVWMPNYGVYAGTKTHNMIFADLFAFALSVSTKTKYLVTV